MGAWALGRPARSLAGKCQTNLVLPVRPDSFMEQSELKAGRAQGYCRFLGRAKPRGLLLFRGDMRSIAGYCLSWPDKVTRPITVDAQAKPRDLSESLGKSKNRLHCCDNFCGVRSHFYDPGIPYQNYISLKTP